MKKIVLFVLLFFTYLTTDAQNSAIKILQKFVAKIHSLKSLSYSDRLIQKNPFSSGDTSVFNSYSAFVFENANIKSLVQQTDMNNGQSKTSIIFANDTLFELDQNDSSHTFKKHPERSELSSGILNIAALVEGDLNKRPGIIFRRSDTTISGGISCYNFFIRTYDTVDNNLHNFNYDYLLVDKASLMPVYYKAIGDGTAEKEGHVIGRLQFFSEDFFTGFHFNDSISAAAFTFIKSDFPLHIDSSLTAGTIAPQFNLKYTDGRQTIPSDFKNKLLLIAFGGTLCGANPLANPMLNRINEKYSHSKFSIVAIYAGEPASQVQKYIANNSLHFPVYLGDKKVTKAFKSQVTPDFYLIDKNGKIIKIAHGYDDDLEKNLTQLIDHEIQE